MPTRKSDRTDLVSLVERMGKLEQQVARLATVIENNQTHRKTSGLAFGLLSAPLNPWADSTARGITESMSKIDKEIGDKLTTKTYEAYKPTIEALKTSINGLTAEEVSKISRRSRNLESARLWRLYAERLVERKRVKGRVIYSLKDPKSIDSIFRTG